MSIRLMSVVWELQTLTSTQKLVLLALADNASDEGVCWPSITTVARKSSLARSTVAEQLNDLEAMNLIVRDRGNSHRSTVYTVNLGGSPPAGLVRQPDGGSPPRRLEVVRQPDGGSPPAGLQSSDNHQREPSKNTQTRARGVDYAWFQTVKAAYPAGTFPAVTWLDAERAVNQLIEDGEPAEQILTMVEEFAAQQKAMGRLGTQFITSPNKFFRSGAWRGPFPLPERPKKPTHAKPSLKGWMPPEYRNQEETDVQA